MLDKEVRLIYFDGDFIVQYFFGFFVLRWICTTTLRARCILPYLLAVDQLNVVNHQCRALALGRVGVALEH